MKSEIEKIQALVEEARSILDQKNCLFDYDVYVKVDSALFLNFDLHSFENNRVICQYGYNLKSIEKRGLDCIVDKVIEESKKIVLNNLKNTDTWSPEKQRIVLVLDIMGFKNMINNFSPDEIYLKLYKIFTNFNNLMKMPKVLYSEKIWVELFSDTIFIISSDCNDTTISIINMFVSGILWQALELGIVFKGAYAEGKIIVDRENHICFGQPIIDAYLLMENQAWFGIACHKSVKSISKDKIDTEKYIDGKMKIVQRNPIFIPYDIPLKNGTEKLLSFAWFNHGFVEYDKIKKKLITLRANSPSKVKIYYDRLLDFMNFCQEQGDLWLSGESE